MTSTELERVFFGRVDSSGRRAVDFWTHWDTTTADPDALAGLLDYMSTQKLRTPKGLDWQAGQLNTRNPGATLGAVVRFRQFFNAIWTECVWQIADASQSETKFIVSDHPVTVYNRAYAPEHRKCRGADDPQIHLSGTHTIFPLSMEKVLILTNLSWALNPWGSPEKERPHAVYERDAILNLTEIQLGRQLDEDEVRAINFIIKSRAYRFIAAADEDWLYPERHFARKPKWSQLGPFYLLFPDPRSLHYGGEITLGYSSGASRSFDAFGRRPGQEGYMADSLPAKGDPLSKFKGEFAQHYGPKRRGFLPLGFEGEKAMDAETLHEYHLSLVGRRRRTTAENLNPSRHKKRGGGRRKR